jgi:hypothetical protein
MQVLLLDVSGASLEGFIAMLAVDEHSASNHAHCYATGEDIKKSRLACTRYTL